MIRCNREEDPIGVRFVDRHVSEVAVDFAKGEVMVAGDQLVAGQRDGLGRPFERDFRVVREDGKLAVAVVCFDESAQKGPSSGAGKIRKRSAELTVAVSANVSSAVCVSCRAAVRSPAEVQTVRAAASRRSHAQESENRSLIMPSGIRMFGRFTEDPVTCKRG